MPRGPGKHQGLFVVRLYDGFDRYWIDIGSPCNYEEAFAIWNEKTKNGTERTTYQDIDYYDIFPANTRMLFDGS
jgi:NDP-sugar pyrophosphorylase family protein